MPGLVSARRWVPHDDCFHGTRLIFRSRVRSRFVIGFSIPMVINYEQQEGKKIKKTKQNKQKTNKQTKTNEIIDPDPVY